MQIALAQIIFIFLKEKKIVPTLKFHNFNAPPQTTSYRKLQKEEKRYILEDRGLQYRTTGLCNSITPQTLA